MSRDSAKSYIATPSCPHLMAVLRSKSAPAFAKAYECAISISVDNYTYRDPEDKLIDTNGVTLTSYDLASVKQKFLNCSKCSGPTVSIFLCVQCHVTGCLRHMQDHNKEQNHFLAVRCSTGEIFCLKCQDFVFHPTFERQRIQHIERNILRRVRSKGLSLDHWTLPSYPGPPIYPTEHLSAKAEQITTQSDFPSHKEITGLRGFVNLGSTCFMSSVLQSLVHNPFIKSYYFSGSHLLCPHYGDNECLSCCLNDILKEFYTSPELKGFGITDLLTASWKVKRSLAGFEEQDAHEFWQFLMGEMHKTDPSRKKLENSKSTDCNCIIHSTFGGTLVSTLECLNCGKTRSTHDPIMDISLEITAKNSNLSKENLNNKKSSTNSKFSTPIPGVANDLLPSVISCFDQFCHTEELDFLSTCPHCKVKSKTNKNLKLGKIPKVLVIQLKRFEHGVKGGRKVDGVVPIEMRLNLEKYTDKNNKIASKRRVVGKTVPGQQVTEPTSDEIIKQIHGNNPTTYELFAVIVHIGQVHTGHYVAYVKQNGYWFRCDDDKVVCVSEDTVKNEKGYLLFYCISE